MLDISGDPPTTAAASAEAIAPVTPQSSLAALLGNVAEAQTLTDAERGLQDQLVKARLGVAGGLFTALRAKHSPTAQHCLRVALRCSSVGSALRLPPRSLDHLEIAALLHDVGKIGVPDHVLTKPAPLDRVEVEMMHRYRETGLEILSSCSADSEVVEIVRCSTVRYDSVRQPDDTPVPIGARILAIADAYDAMTTDHVYRKSLPRERALAELFQHAGSQFDPHLVDEFARISSASEADLNAQVGDRWTQQLGPDGANQFWELQRPLFENDRVAAPALLFQQRLLDAMYDGVVFIDARHRIVLWNRGAERLSGRSRESVQEKEWDSSILGLRDQEGNLIRQDTCPIDHVIQTGVQTLRRVNLTRQGGGTLTVDAHVIPVLDAQHRCFGVTVILHDVSPEMNLEKRVQNLHERATTDQLTNVNNRAEFDRVMQSQLKESLRAGTPFSIILCDIDHFKQVNDVHGHQAGDEALVSFAALLQQHAGEHDVVARYGGEEFVIVCANRDNASTERLAEEIRYELSQVPQPMLGGKHITSSFGVTEVQLGDTVETILRRADRALYQAKESGRNRVVQLGAGFIPDEASNRPWLSWLTRRTPDCLLQRELIANGPINLLVEKIKGFIADHAATIVTIEGNLVVLTMTIAPEQHRRQADRPISINVEMQLREVTPVDACPLAVGTCTMITVMMRPNELVIAGDREWIRLSRSWPASNRI